MADDPPPAQPAACAHRPGGVALGLIVRSVRLPEIAGIAAASDHDFLVIDTQTAVLDRQNVAGILAAARHAGIAGGLRARGHDDPDAVLWLDAGASGFIVPMSPVPCRRAASFRGAVSLRAALCDALDSGRQMGAGLGVYDTEPPRADCATIRWC